MSQDEPISRKEKKAQRDADRRKSGKKRKHEDVGDGNGHVDELQQDFIPLEVDSSPAEPKKAKSKSKKRKLEDGAAAAAGALDEEADTAVTKLKKKRRKHKTTTDVAEVDGETTKSKPRFVCFIGNLPFNTTDETLQAHFKKLMPFTIRHRLDAQTKKSKGYAFMEFDNYDRMKTCLKLYHHTMFDPNNVTDELEHADVGSGANAVGAKGSKKKGGRRINVELTAGGGGKNANRKEKIKVKNERLNGQRLRRAEAEKAERAKEGRAKKPKDRGVEDVSAAVEHAAEVPSEVHNAGMHPSRLARLAG